MTTRTLAIISSVALLAPLFAAEAFAQRPGGARPPVVQQRPPANPQDYGRDGRDFRNGSDRDRAERYRLERERERLAAAAFRDGYEAGLRAGRDRRRFDLTAESRYRNGDRGYNRGFGPRDLYRFFYRDAFRNGYERGYMEARRNDRRGPGLSIWWRW